MPKRTSKKRRAREREGKVCEGGRKGGVRWGKKQSKGCRQVNRRSNNTVICGWGCQSSRGQWGWKNDDDDDYDAWRQPCSVVACFPDERASVSHAADFDVIVCCYGPLYLDFWCVLDESEVVNEEVACVHACVVCIRPRVLTR